MSNMTETRAFCDDALWDLNITWYTDTPDFTTCFHQTILTYVPAAFLLLLSPISIYSSKQSRDKKVPWTIVTLLKVAINLLLIILPIIDLGYAIDNK